MAEYFNGFYTNYPMARDIAQSALYPYNAGDTIWLPDDKGMTFGNTTAAPDVVLLWDSVNSVFDIQTSGLKINSAYTLPVADGALNEVLTTNGAGVVSWAAAGGGGGQWSRDAGAAAIYPTTAGDDTWLPDNDKHMFGNVIGTPDWYINFDATKLNIYNTGQTANTYVYMNGARLYLDNGNDQVFIGDDAGLGSLGSRNIAIGDKALDGGIGATAFDNIAIGKDALGILSGNYSSNTVMGGYAMSNVANCQRSSAYGFYALRTGGNYQSGYGYRSGYAASGSYVSFFGYYSGENAGAATYSSYFGTYSGQNNTGSNNFGGGAYTLQTGDGTYNSAGGYYAMQANSGSYGSGFGNSALQTGSGNYMSAFGYHSGLNVGAATYSSYYGAFSGNGNTGDYNSGFGKDSLYTGDGSYCIGLGSYSGKYETGSNKLFIDSLDRTTEANGRAFSIVYGVMAAALADQTLRINGNCEIGDAANSNYSGFDENGHLTFYGNATTYNDIAFSIGVGLVTPAGGNSPTWDPRIQEISALILLILTTLYKQKHRKSRIVTKKVRTLKRTYISTQTE